MGKSQGVTGRIVYRFLSASWLLSIDVPTFALFQFTIEKEGPE